MGTGCGAKCWSRRRRWILLTIIVIILLGNPSSGRATGVPYLPTFWRDLGPYLPPRNAYILLHPTTYFNDHGTTEAPTILLV